MHLLEACYGHHNKYHLITGQSNVPCMGAGLRWTRADSRVVAYDVGLMDDC